ncbi:hypothetical protein EAS64_41580 [Trebonia kvetii]|uniref:Lipopolysaccharide biosynthesis protein n=1 Tax=Trebonia kvetii TaxID=2480626 RepID=A0A6P2BL41_9ACTN|nr:oligosaccharide flippase family protein [Trebonia kvetii]TVY99736.1 hypothetical protein EAS64_41580 [Trebonia kvetii]
MASASALAQLVGQSVSFVQTVILARLLTPTDVGIFAAGTVLTALLTDVAAGGLQAGLVQRQGDQADADETVFRVTLMVGAAAGLGCLAAAPVIGIIFNSRTAGLVAAATSGLLLLHALTNVPEAVLQREFSVKRRLIVGPAIAVSYATVAIGLAALGWGVWSMVAGTYASYTAWVISLWTLTSWRPGRGHASFAIWRELARYGFPLALAMIGYRVRTAVESLVVGRFLSTAALGFFRYGQRIALIPQIGIIQVGATTLFPAFSRIADDPKRFAAAYLRVLHWGMIGSAAATGLMIAAGEPAVVVLLGERWRGAGVALVAMSGLSIGSAVSVVAQDVIKAHGRTRLINWFTLGDLVLGVSFLLILIWPFGFVGASLYISLTSLADAAIFLGLAQKVVTVPLSKVLTVLATPMPGLLIATAATWWLEHDILRSDSHSLILAVTLLAVDALVFCLIYLAVLTLFARSTVITIVRSVAALIGRFRQRALADTTTSSADHAAPSSPSRQSAESGPLYQGHPLSAPMHTRAITGPALGAASDPRFSEGQTAVGRSTPMSFGAHLARIWRRWFLVVIITLLAGLAAFGSAARHAGTEYTGTATLTTVSQNSSPDQTAALSTGYVAMFLQPSYQSTLHTELRLPADVSLTAQTAAQSPIIFISATGPDSVMAQRAAADAAAEFLRQVNANLQANRQNLIGQMRRAVEADMKAGAIKVPAETDMQDRINAVNADPTSDLQMLQANAGVSVKSSGTKKTLAVALLGGLIFGALLAWVLGAASRRLSSPAELMEKARIEPLVVIPPGGGATAERQRERQLRQLAATVALLNVPKPTVVAVAPVERMPGTDEIAESLARYRADHGARTILVHADGTPAPLDAVEGDFESVALRWSLVSSESGGRMREVFPVSDPQDVHGLLGMEHLGNLVASLRSRADLVVIQSPAVSESAESYMVCSVADRTLLVAGAGSSADSVLAARDQMERVGVSLLGVAFVERPRRRLAATGDSSKRTTATVNSQATDAWPSEAAAAPGASSQRLDETKPGVDPSSRASRI